MKRIRLGITDLSFHHVTGALVAHVLQDMGFACERVYAHHEENFRRLQSGEVDMLCSAWLPSSHGVYKSQVEQSVKLRSLGLHYEPYALWGVPDYVPVEQVSEVADLLKPEVLDKMARKIQGINAGAGISRFSQEMISAYGLDAAGYQFFTGTEEDCFGTFEQAVARKDWLIVPLWKPQFLHHKYTIRELHEPKGLLGQVDQAVMLLREDKCALFSDQQLKQLDALRFSNDIIAALDYAVCREGQSVDDAAKDWFLKARF